MRMPRSSGRLRRYFDRNDGRMIHKWLHYFPIYEEHLERYRGRDVRLLEIGVSHGGSLQMWRDYFGSGSTIVGVDVAPRVAALGGDGIRIEIGDQGDAEFLRRIADRYGPFDIVIDDGSHLPVHQIVSIEALWPTLAERALYIVEDLHSNYWADYRGGRHVEETFMTWTFERIHDMHAFHSEEQGFEPTMWTHTLNAIHTYDSVVVFDRAPRDVPEHRKTGWPSFDDVPGVEPGGPLEPLHQQQLDSLEGRRARLRRTRRRVATRIRSRVPGST